MAQLGNVCLFVRGITVLHDGNVFTVLHGAAQGACAVATSAQVLDGDGQLCDGRCGRDSQRIALPPRVACTATRVLLRIRASSLIRNA